MSDVAAGSEVKLNFDVRTLLENKNAPIADLVALRRAVAVDPEIHEQVKKILAELPATLEEAGRSQAQIRTKGFAHFARGDDRKAVEWLGKAGDDPRVRHVLGRALIGAGRFDAAVEALEGLSGDDASASLVRAEALLRAGRADEARKAVQKLSREDRATPEGLYLAGHAAELEGNYDEAYDSYQRALELDPNHPKARFRLAFCLDLDGHEDQAVEHYEILRRQKPVHANALINLGVLYEDRGEYSKAMELYREILDVDPNHPRARRFLGDARGSLSMYYDDDLERTEDRRAQILKIPISDFELSVRSRNCLAKMNIETLGDLIKKTEPELLSYKNFGETSLQEIKDILAQKGLRLGMGREEATASVQSAARTLLGIEPEKGDVMQKPIEDLELSVRSRNAMASLGIETLGELARLTEKDLMEVKNFGQTSMNEIKEKLAEFGLSLAEDRE